MTPDSQACSLSTHLRAPARTASWLFALVVLVVVSISTESALAASVGQDDVLLPNNPFARTSSVVSDPTNPGEEDVVILTPHTPMLTDLIGGPSPFGISALFDAETMPDASLRQLIESGRDQGRAALFFRIDASAILAGDEFAGFDLVGLVNLGDRAFSAASLAALDPSQLTSFISVGLAGLDAGAIFLTLAPEGQVSASGWGVEIDLDGRRFSASGSETGEVFEFIGVVPEPGTALLLGLGLAGLAHRGRSYEAKRSQSTISR
jgi:hypothetical protein